MNIIYVTVLQYAVTTSSAFAFQAKTLLVAFGVNI